MIDSHNQLKDQALKTLENRREKESASFKEKEAAAKKQLAEETRIKAENLKRQAEKNKYDIDRLQLYLGEPYVLNDKITIKQPTVGDIIRFGEQKAYSVVHIFIANTTMYRLVLWDMGIDWNKISDFELFQFLCHTLNQEDTSFLFGDLDFSKLRRYQKQIPQPENEAETEMKNDDEQKEESTIVLYDPEQDVEIDEETYNKIAWYVRNLFNIFPKVEKAKGKFTKQSIIDEDRMNYERHKNESYQSTLLPLISSCLNHPGFKYTKQQLINVGIVEFMDSVQRLQVYESSTALLKGMYSGFISGKDIKPEQIDFMRDLSK